MTFLPHAAPAFAPPQLLHQSLRPPAAPLSPGLPCTCPTRPRPHRTASRTPPPSPIWRSEASPEPATEQAAEPATEPASVASETPKPPTYQVQLLSSVTDLQPEQWDRFARAGSANPFLRHDWLRCLEQSGCASASTGWTPQHIVLRDADSGKLAAIAPAYIKQHSLGEFVFDHDWADAAYGAGIMYYPKLLVAIPFTPAAGRRILTEEGVEGKERHKILQIVGRALVQVCDAMRVSSVHVNFCCEDEVSALSAAGFLLRKGVQYHFTNYKKGQNAIAKLERKIKREDGLVEGSSFADIGARVPYLDFDDYLSEFKSKRRIKMRRERNIVREESGLTIEVVRGDQIDSEMMETMFSIYKSTIDKLLYGRQYLTLKFFQMLNECEEFKQRICLVLARSVEDGRVVGGTFNIVGEEDGGAFYGRYWGCTEDFRYLHFEVCYYAAIEYCIEQGLSRMEPGAGGGDFKYMRGFEPSVTRSMHFLRDNQLSDAVERYLQLEAMQIDGAVTQMKDASAIRAKAPKRSRKQSGSEF